MGKPTILVVEDDSILREIVSIALQKSGFEVAFAGTGAEALSLITDGSPFAGLYTDIQLPGTINGWKVGVAFYERWPTKPIVYASSRDFPIEEVARHPGIFLRKPLDLRAVAAIFQPFYVDEPDRLPFDARARGRPGTNQSVAASTTSSASTRSMPLLRALYVSRPVLDPKSGGFERMIASVLGVSRERNERDWITGSLLAGQSCFIQAIEGEAAVVAATMNRIERDPRHQLVRRFDDQAVEERIFGEWSMFFGRIEQIDPLFVHALSQTGTLDPFTMDRQQLLTCLCAGALFPSERATTLRLDKVVPDDEVQVSAFPKARLQ